MATLNDTAETFTIDRSGERKLRFKGWKMASVRDRWLNGREQTRWTELSAYKTTGGNYVLVTEEVTLWQGESGSTHADLYKSAEDLVAAIGGKSSLEKELLDDLGAQFADLAIEEVA